MGEILLIMAAAVLASALGGWIGNYMARRFPIPVRACGKALWPDAPADWRCTMHRNHRGACDRIAPLPKAKP